MNKTYRFGMVYPCSCDGHDVCWTCTCMYLYMCVYILYIYIHIYIYTHAYLAFCAAGTGVRAASCIEVLSEPLLTKGARGAPCTEVGTGLIKTRLMQITAACFAETMPAERGERSWISSTLTAGIHSRMHECGMMMVHKGERRVHVTRSHVQV